MPHIRADSIEQHHDLVWTALAGALRQLLRERDYDSITLGHITAHPA